MAKPSRKRLETEYRRLLQAAGKARARCYNADGDLVTTMRGPGGEAVPNPYLAEWHRCVAQAQSLARDLGITGPTGPVAEVSLTEATATGDRERELEALLAILAQAVEENPRKAALVREYRETANQLAELREAKPDDGRISALVAEGAARAHRLGLTVVR